MTGPWLCVTVRFLGPMCHARGDGGGPEWPPSPLRLFQALVAAAAARWNERIRLETAEAALLWLERLPAPWIVAPAGNPAATSYRLYVPDNVADKVASSWSRGGSDDISKYRSEKDVRPTNLAAKQDEAVAFLWPLPDALHGDHLDVLVQAARSITHLGWGIDMVVADASVLTEGEAAALPGERWRPGTGPGSNEFRVPIPGTLHVLMEKHRAFLERLGPEGFRPVPPLTTFAVVPYRCATDPPRSDFAAFSLLELGGSRFRAFDPARHGKVVAGMLRHAAGIVAPALGWSKEKAAGFVLGHGESAGEPHRAVAGPRLAFLPIPSIEPRGKGRPEVVACIRRALVAVVGGDAHADLQRLARLLSGSELVREDDRQPVALLGRPPDDDSMIGRYTKASAIWTTVTPVILPGYDDPRKLRKRLAAPGQSEPARLDPMGQQKVLDTLDRRIDFRLRKSVPQAGYSEELARFARIEWRSTGFLPGCEPAIGYATPEKLRRYRRLHAQITWRDASGRPIPLPGPLCLGGGRFVGLGLFVGRRL